MISVTNTQYGDFNEVTALINHVFGKENSPVKMEDIFTDLLNKNNMKHMRIIKADGKPVSVINYIINEVDINGCVMKAANIGAVGTHKDCRHRGYSSLILKNCLEEMKKEGVDLLYVSGEIGLYTGNNIHITGNMFTFSIDKNSLAGHNGFDGNDCEVKICSNEDLQLLFPIYDAETVKFIRDKRRFIDLAGRVPGASVFNHTAKVFRIEENGQIQGYFICAIVPEENGDFKMEVIEYAGKREAVLKGFIKILAQLHPASISGYAAWFDTAMLKALEDNNMKMEGCCYPGTMRIIDFTRFTQKLKPLFLKKGMGNIEFNELAGNYIIQSGNMKLVIGNDKAMHELLLGKKLESLQTQDIVGDDKLLNTLKSILPIPVPYPYSLNYI